MTVIPLDKQPARCTKPNTAKPSVSIAETSLSPEQIDALVAATVVEVPAPGEDAALPWQLHTLADAYAPRPPVEYVINGLFKLPSLNVVFGAPGSMKSAMLADNAACVVSGKPVFEPLDGAIGVCRGTKRVPVLWADFDNGVQLTHERFEAVGRAYNLPADAPLSYVSMPEPWLDMNVEAGKAMLDQYIKHTGAKLVIVDNLRAVSGGADENSAFMLDIMTRFRRLAEANNAAVVLIHHTNRNGAIRGSSTIEQAIDLSLSVERTEGKDTISVFSKKVRGAPVQPFSVAFKYKHKDNTQGELHSFRFFGVRMDAEQDTADQLDAAILMHLQANTHGVTQLALCDAVASITGKSKSKVYRRLRDLKDEGKVHIESGESNKKLYFAVYQNEGGNE